MDHLAVLPVVAWAAVELGVLVGAPGARRRFMDRGVVATRPAALETLGRYREALRQKRELLARGGTGIEIWNELLAATAAEVIRLRAAYVDALRAELTAVLAEVGEIREISAGPAAAAGPAPPPTSAAADAVLFGSGSLGTASASGDHPSLGLPEIELRYHPSPPQGLEGPAAIAAVLDKAVERERRRQQPLLGPQRDELEILWGGHELRRVASAGERKALSLLLLAAHGRVVEAAGRQPVYLLDDADAELAPSSVAAVWSVFARRVAATGGQLFASSNRPQVWLTLDVDTLWEVARGRLARL
jgi:DNA replication and repair protein RecF